MRAELSAELLKDFQSPDDTFGDDGLFPQLTEAVGERALQGDTDASPRR